MPTFFFDFNDGDLSLSDQDGTLLENAETASRQAITALAAMTKDVLPDGPKRTLSMTIRDEKGNAIYAAKIVFSGQWFL